MKLYVAHLKLIFIHLYLNLKNVQKRVINTWNFGSNILDILPLCHKWGVVQKLYYWNYSCWFANITVTGCVWVTVSEYHSQQNNSTGEGRFIFFKCTQQTESREEISSLLDLKWLLVSLVDSINFCWMPNKYKCNYTDTLIYFK